MMKKAFAALFIVLAVILPLSAYSFEELSDAMVLNNKSLLMKDEGVKQAELDVKNAKANYSPNISATVTGTYMVNPPIDKISVSTDDIMSQVMPGAPATGGYVTVFDGMPNTMYNASLNIMQPLFTWGKIGGGVDLSQEVLKIKKLDRNNQFDILSVQLEGLLGSLTYLDHIMALLDEADQTSTELIGIAESGVENGVMLKIDLLDAEVKKNELDVRRVELKNQYDDVLDQIRLLTGILDLEREDIGYTPREDDWLSVFSLDRISLKEKALSGNNKALAMADGMVEVSKIAQKIQKSMFYGKPDIALNVGLSYGGPLFPLIETNWTRKDDYGVNFTVAMRTTLWDGGKIKHNIDKAGSQMESAELTAESARDQIGTEFDKAWRAADLSIEKLEYQKEKDELYQKQIEVMELKKEAGSGSESDILQKKLEVIENEVNMDLEKINIMTNGLMIEYLAGLRK